MNFSNTQNEFDTDVFRKSVNLAVKFLDCIIPDWVKKIDWEEFQLNSSRKCVIGQLGGESNNVYDLEEYVNSQVFFAFNPWEFCRYGSMPKDYPTQIWLQELRKLERIPEVE
jgi:hypothetical protein